MLEELLKIFLCLTSLDKKVRGGWMKHGFLIPRELKGLFAFLFILPFMSQVHMCTKTIVLLLHQV